MNVEIGTKALIFLSWEYLFQIFGILALQCIKTLSYSVEVKLKPPEDIEVGHTRS